MVDLNFLIDRNPDNIQGEDIKEHTNRVKRFTLNHRLLILVQKERYIKIIELKIR